MLRNLERCLARVNEHFYKNNIILAVDDKGKLSCHKITLIFLYFDATDCIVSRTWIELFFCYPISSLSVVTLLTRLPLSPFQPTRPQKHLNGLLNRDNGLESINNTINNLNQLNNNNSNAINLNKYGTSSQPIDMMQQDVEVDDIIITGLTPTRLTQKEVG